MAGGVTEVLPENDVFGRLAHRRPARPDATCIGRSRPHRRDAHRGRRRFSGQTRDGRYCRARYYHSGLQRFISDDPIGFAGGDPNLYAYVFNAPTGLRDPSGLAVDPISLTAFGIFCGGGAAINVTTQFVLSGRRPTLAGAASAAAVGCGVGVLTLTAGIAAGAVAVTGAVGAGMIADATATGATAVALSKLPTPALPPGMTNRAFGQLMGWGQGSSDTARAAITNLSRDKLERAGVTVEMLKTWSEFYANESLRNPGNPSAAGRVELLKAAIAIMTGGKQ